VCVVPPRGAQRLREDDCDGCGENERETDESPLTDDDAAHEARHGARHTGSAQADDRNTRVIAFYARRVVNEPPWIGAKPSTSRPTPGIDGLSFATSTPSGTARS